MPAQVHKIERIGGIILRILGLILLVAAALKGRQLLVEPVASNSLWTSRPILILQVEFELALGIWLLSGLFPKAAWLVALGCFGLFSLITFLKGLTGAASCGCFGSVHVNPWVTLLAIDLPAVISLGLFPVRSAFAPLWSFLRRRESIRNVVAEFAKPLPSLTRFAATAVLGLAVPAVTAPLLAFNKPASITSAYEVLEPETWVGKKLPILEHIDIADQLKTGTWLLLLYHHDCPDCRRAIPQYEQMARDPAGNEDFLGTALIEVPPYGPAQRRSPGCACGRLADAKEWFMTTPAVFLISESITIAAWEGVVPDCESVIHIMSDSELGRALHISGKCEGSLYDGRVQGGAK